MPACDHIGHLATNRMPLLSHLGEKLHVSKGTLWEESTRVPLIIRSASTRPGEVVEKPVSLVDIAPTVLELAGVDARGREGFDLDGTSLFSGATSPVHTVWDGAHSLRTRRWRYTRYKDGGEELYDHRQDPSEQVNLAGKAEMQEQLQRLRKRIPSGAQPG